MTNSSFARPALFLAAVATIGACSSGRSGPTSTAPAPTTSSAPSSAPAAAAPATGGLPSGVTAAMVAMGDSIYHARGCRNCHGPDAKGRQNGPDLTSGKFMHVNGSYNDFVRIITTGVPADSIKDKSHALPMPPRGGSRPAVLTDDEIRAVAAYVYSLNHH
jgi:mono/diheme cytochrome c family protein